MTANAAQERIATDTSKIFAVLDSMKQARFEKSARAVAASYAPAAAIFNLAPPLVHHGIDLAETEAWFDTWEGPVEIETRDFDVRIAGDLAFCHGYMRLAGTKKGAEGKVSFWMRETLCFEREGNGWRIVHEHTSTPFYMDTYRPAFDLKPDEL